MQVFVITEEVDYETRVVCVFASLEAAVAFVSLPDHGGYSIDDRQGAEFFQ